MTAVLVTPKQILTQRCSSFNLKISYDQTIQMFNLLSAELIFLFSSYSAYLIARFAFFSVSIIFATAKFCGKVPDGQFQFAGAKFCVEIFDEVYNCCSFCTRCVGMVKIKIKAHDIESRSF